jgi:hypothetical protein
VTDQERRLGTEFADEAADVGGEQVDGVGLEALWLRRQVVATQVGRDDSKARRRERRDLQPPAEPELRKTVQQNDQRPITGLDVVQARIADLGVTLAKLGPDVREQGRGAHDDLPLLADSGDKTPTGPATQQVSRHRRDLSRRMTFPHPWPRRA